MAKKKYNPDDVERWVTVKGARIPIMKDGSFGVGTVNAKQEDNISKKINESKYNDYPEHLRAFVKMDTEDILRLAKEDKDYIKNLKSSISEYYKEYEKVEQSSSIKEEASFYQKYKDLARQADKIYDDMGKSEYKKYWNYDFAMILKGIGNRFPFGWRHGTEK